MLDLNIEVCQTSLMLCIDRFTIFSRLYQNAKIVTQSRIRTFGFSCHRLVIEEPDAGAALGWLVSL